MRVVDNKLQIDLDGAKGSGQWEDWAVLDGVTKGDRVAVKTDADKGGKSGKGDKSKKDYVIVDGGDGGVTPPDFYVTLGRQGAWFDSNENGKLDGKESLAAVTDGNSDGFYTVDGID